MFQALEDLEDKEDPELLKFISVRGFFLYRQ
jgi:hypothetical protein